MAAEHSPDIVIIILILPIHVRSFSNKYKFLIMIKKAAENITYGQ